MKTALNTEQRVACILGKMHKAMPEIKRQIAVYEKSIKFGNQTRKSKVTVHSRNV